MEIVIEVLYTINYVESIYLISLTKQVYSNQFVVVHLYWLNL